MEGKGQRPVTVITGGSRGIGAATAVQLAAKGHDLALAYREDSTAAQRLATSLEDEGVRCLTVRVDVTREDEVERLFGKVSASLGVVTGVVNNAGVTALIADLAETPVDVLRQVVEVNFMGVLLCCRTAIQQMSVRRGGRGGAIVNVSSAAASLGSPHEYVHYAATKAAVDTLTTGLAKEVADDGIRINAVAPGTVLTDIHAAAGDPDRPNRVAPRIPLGRAGHPDEIASAITWLLSDQASYTTGAIVRVAGGL